MKRISILPAIAVCALFTGCESPVPTFLSVEPIAGANDTVIDPALLGTWEEPGGKDLAAVIRPADQGYQISILAGGSVLAFGAKLFRVKDSEFLDLVPEDDNDFRVPGHAIVRLWIDGPGLRWAFLDSDWLKQQAASLPAHTAGGKMQLFAPSDTVRAFLAVNGLNDKAYGKTATWQKAQ